MGRELRWNNVKADPNAGMQYALHGSNLITRALDNLNKPLADYNLAQKENAKSQSDANTGAYKQAILEGENPELSGAYNSNILADATRQFDRDEQADKLSNARLAIAQAGNRRQNRAEQRQNRAEQRSIAKQAAMDTWRKSVINGINLPGNPTEGVVPNEKDVDAAVVDSAQSANANDAAVPAVAPIAPAPIVNDLNQSGLDDYTNYYNPTDTGIEEPIVGDAIVKAARQIDPILEAEAVKQKEGWLGIGDSDYTAGLTTDNELQVERNRKISAATQALTNPRITGAGINRAQTNIGNARSQYKKDTRQRIKEENAAKKQYSKEIDAQITRNSTAETLLTLADLDNFKPYEGNISEGKQKINKNMALVESFKENGVISPGQGQQMVAIVDTIKQLRKSEDTIDMNKAKNFASQVTLDNKGKGETIAQSVKDIDDQIKNVQKAKTDIVDRPGNRSQVDTEKYYENLAKEKNKLTGYDKTSSVGRGLRTAGNAIGNVAAGIRSGAVEGAVGFGNLFNDADTIAQRNKMIEGTNARDTENYTKTSSDVEATAATERTKASESFNIALDTLQIEKENAVKQEAFDNSLKESTTLTKLSKKSIIENIAAKVAATAEAMPTLTDAQLDKLNTQLVTEYLVNKKESAKQLKKDQNEIEKAVAKLIVKRKLEKENAFDVATEKAKSAVMTGLAKEEAGL